MGKRFETVQVPKEVCVGVTCDSCGVEMKAVLTEHIGDNHYVCTIDGALYVKVDGSGYGEFMDGEPSRKGILCEDCARELLATYPFLRTPPEPQFEDDEWSLEL
jgi:hypothetical protein